jgi:hypothetical protein
MAYIIPDSKLSPQCKKNIEESMAYLNSAARKSYSNQRIQNDFGDYRAAFKKGLAILDKNGKAMLRAISEARAKNTRST